MSGTDIRLEYFKAQHELARNFYDDYEFCPLPLIEEAHEHRERIHCRTSPYSSPAHSPVRSYSIPTISKKAITIIDPSNMAPVLLPLYQHPYQQPNRNCYHDATSSGSYYSNATVNELSPYNSVVTPPLGIYGLSAY